MQANYTVDRIQEVEKRVTSDLEAIRKLLLEHIVGLRYLILVGGFGRGEGSVLFENGTPQPINDYDIAIVSEKKPEQSSLKRLSVGIAKRINIRLIDLIPIRLADASRLPYTMFNYDMKYGGHVFFGKGDILDKIPDYDPSRMPLLEGKLLLFNRMICLLESFSEEFRKRSLCDDERFFLINQSSKVILACCDSHLLSKKKYHHSYVERCKRFSELFENHKRLLDLVQLATEFKLRPKRDIGVDPVRYWFDARKMFVQSLFEFLEIFYERNFDDYETFCVFYEKEGQTHLRRIMSMIRSRYSGTVNYRKNIELLELFLILAIDETSYVDRFLRLSKSCLKEISNIPSPDCLEWESMRKECVRLWFKRLH